MEKGLINIILKFFATGFFISYLPAVFIKHIQRIFKTQKFSKNTGAGLLGTIVGFVCYPFLPQSHVLYIVFLLVFTYFAYIICKFVRFEDDTDDNPKIVIDEIVGYFFAIAFLPREIIFLLIAFVLFRVFDTIKPFGIRKLDGHGSKFSIILDDIMAGVLANIITLVIVFIT